MWQESSQALEGPGLGPLPLHSPLPPGGRLPFTHTPPHPTTPSLGGTPTPPPAHAPPSPEFRSLSLTWSLQTPPHLAAHPDPSASPVGR